jgi:hypothetical protein
MHRLTGHSRLYDILADHLDYTLRNASSTRRLWVDDGTGESRNDDPRAGGGYASAPAPLDRRSVPQRLTWHQPPHFLSDFDTAMRDARTSGCDL